MPASPANEPHAAYLQALGAFRQQSIVWASCARRLGVLSRTLDPAGALPPHPLAGTTAAEIIAEFRAVAMTNPGIRELFAAAFGGA
jgi:hypothetical protein